MNNLFIYRCEFCPFECRDPVKGQDLGSPSPRHCKESETVRIDMKDILFGQEKVMRDG
jgi:hypothetical protein